MVAMEMKYKAFFLFVVLCVVESKRGPRHRKERHRVARHNMGAEDGTCSLSVSCTNTSMVPINLPIFGPQGPPGRPGKRGERGEDGIPGIPGVPGADAESTPKAAFFVGLKHNTGAIKEDQVLVFDSIVTNMNGYFDEEKGHFIAPFSGYYKFTVVVAAQGRQRAAVMLMHNTRMIVTVWAESIPSWGSASNTVIIRLEKGDKVWLNHMKRAPYLHGYMYSTFSGHLLFLEG